MSATTRQDRPAPAQLAHGHGTQHATLTARALAARICPPKAAGVFTPGLLELLPEPARRWLRRAVAPGTPLYTGAQLQMHGEIKLGHWHRFTAVQTLVPGVGFVWSARTHLVAAPVHGFDALVDGEGRQEWHCAGLPFLAATGADVTRSAADRLAAEAVLVPTSLLGACWRYDRHHTDAASYALPVDGRYSRPRVRIEVDQDGRLDRVYLRRWGQLPDGGYGPRSFYVDFSDEFEVDGLRLPDGIRAAWYDDDGRRDEFFRARLDAVTLRADGGSS